jgi:hypothetical protein
MRSDIIPGASFPDYSLPDHTGTVRTLSELQSGDPLILTLARGHYCPKEHPDNNPMIPYTLMLRQAWDAGDYSQFHGWNRQASAPAASA